MNKLSKDKRDKLIVVCFGIVATLAVLYLFVLGAQKDKLFLIESQISSAKDKLAKAERLVKSAETIEADLIEGKKKLEFHEKDMAPGQPYYWFLKLLQEFTKREGFDNSFIVDITMPETGDVTLLPKFPYKAASFTVHVNGHFQELGRFLASLENNFPYFRVQNIQLTPEVITINNALSATGTAAQKSSAVASEKINMQLKVVTLVKPATT